MSYHDSPAAALRQVGLELRDAYMVRRQSNMWLGSLGYTLADGTRCVYAPGEGLTCHIGERTLMIPESVLDALDLVTAASQTNQESA